MNLNMKTFYLQSKITFEIISKVNAKSIKEASEFFASRKCLPEDELLKIYNVI